MIRKYIFFLLIILSGYSLVGCSDDFSLYSGNEKSEGETPIEFSKLGRWWGSVPSTHSQMEIDIIGEQDKNTALFGECKWTNEKVDLGILEKLMERSKSFHYHNTHLYLFSKNGFTKGCMDMANGNKNITLVTYEDIINNI